MSDRIAKSLATLVKYNNGAFKSEKQASFLHSMADDGVFVSSFRIHNTTVLMSYFMDAEGVYKVEKETKKQGTSVNWERKTDAVFAEEKAKRDELSANIEKQKTIRAKLQHAESLVKIIEEKRVTAMDRAFKNHSDSLDYIRSVMNHWDNRKANMKATAARYQEELINIRN